MASSQSRRGINERVSCEWSQKLRTYATVGLAFAFGAGRTPLSRSNSNSAGDDGCANDDYGE